MTKQTRLALGAALLLGALPANAHASGGIGLLVFIAAPFVMIPLAFYSGSLLRKPSIPGHPLRPGEFSAIVVSVTLEGLYVVFGFMPMIAAWTSDRGPIGLGTSLFWFASASLSMKLYFFLAGKRKRTLTETD